MKKNLYILSFALMAFATPKVVVASNVVGVTVVSEDVFDFELSTKDQQVEINWENTPANIVSYKIERSFDGKRYTRVYQSSILKEFNYADDLSYIDAEKVYYRFSFQLANGKEVVSDSKFVSLSSQNDLKAKILSNGGQVEFGFYSSKTASVRVYLFNSVGNMVAEDELRAIRGENSHSLSLSGTRSGMYFLRLEQDGQSSTTKFFLR